MKIFISHQRADSYVASQVESRLRIFHQIESYLDVIDPDASATGDALGEHIRLEMGKCSHLLAVVSSATKGSWWVPWEIGVATEKDFPLATYTNDVTHLPVYLTKWPYLRTNVDLDLYAQAAKNSDRKLRGNRTFMAEDRAIRSATRDFFTELRSSLRQ
jgi:hypothetical protein